MDILNVSLREILALAAAASAALTVAALAGQFDWRVFVQKQSAGRVVADYFAPRTQDASNDTGLAVRKEAVILASLGLPDDPRYLTALRVAGALVPALVLLAWGMPPVVTLAGGALGFVIVHHFLEGRWRKFRMSVEKELPTFVSRLSSTLLVVENAQVALADVIETLDEQSPLRVWMERFLAGMASEGASFALKAREEAAAISPSLALVVYQIGRLATAGGSGFARAFAVSGDMLHTILESRAVAGSKAESARQAVWIMLGIMGVIMFMMLSSPAIRQGFREPSAQLVTLVGLGVMAYGYTFMSGMIDEALEG